MDTMRHWQLLEICFRYGALSAAEVLKPNPKALNTLLSPDHIREATTLLSQELSEKKLLTIPSNASNALKRLDEIDHEKRTILRDIEPLIIVFFDDLIAKKKHIEARELAERLPDSKLRRHLFHQLHYLLKK